MLSSYAFPMPNEIAFLGFLLLAAMPLDVRSSYAAPLVN